MPSIHKLHILFSFDEEFESISEGRISNNMILCTVSGWAGIYKVLIIFVAFDLSYKNLSQKWKNNRK